MVRSSCRGGASAMSTSSTSAVAGGGGGCGGACAGFFFLFVELPVRVVGAGVDAAGVWGCEGRGVAADEVASAEPWRAS